MSNAENLKEGLEGVKSGAANVATKAKQFGADVAKGVEGFWEKRRVAMENPFIQGEIGQRHLFQTPPISPPNPLQSEAGQRHLVAGRRKSTRRKSTRRKSTRRKSTRRKSTRRKSTRRKARHGGRKSKRRKTKKRKKNRKKIKKRRKMHNKKTTYLCLRKELYCKR